SRTSVGGYVSVVSHCSLDQTFIEDMDDQNVQDENENDEDDGDKLSEVESELEEMTGETLNTEEKEVDNSGEDKFNLEEEEDDEMETEDKEDCYLSDQLSAAGEDSILLRMSFSWRKPAERRRG
ncbi:hypothetical protein CRENBAI_012852, partial [Crenichthys baileyi]